MMDYSIEKGSYRSVDYETPVAKPSKKRFVKGGDDD